MQQFQNRYPTYQIPIKTSHTMAQDWPSKHQPQDNVPVRPNHQPTPVESLPQRTETPVEPQQAVTSAQQLDWETIAKQQQAEMANFRKRQTHRADEAIVAEKERLLRLVLPVVDNLERALEQSTLESETLRQGIELTQRELTRLLVSEGVTRIETFGIMFDPQWHEAIASLPGQTDPNAIISEIEGGYMLNGKLLRPAKVVVAA